MTLHELFGAQLDEGVSRFETDSMHFKKTNIWNMLYDFQKDCVLSAIQKINKYNDGIREETGCIKRKKSSGRTICSLFLN